MLQRFSLVARSCALSALVIGIVSAAVPASAQATACRTCGTVISTHTYQKPAAQGSGVGMVSGAVVGGLLGNQVGGGNGRTLATVAGAVGGGYAGNAIEKRVRSTTVTQVRVRMKNGSVRTFSERGANRWVAGEPVRVRHGALVARG